MIACRAEAEPVGSLDDEFLALDERELSLERGDLGGERGIASPCGIGLSGLCRRIAYLAGEDDDNPGGDREGHKPGDSASSEPRDAETLQGR